MKNYLKNDVREMVFLTGADKYDILYSLLEAGYTVKAVILPFKSAREERLERVKTLCAERGITILRPKRGELNDTLVSLKPFVLLSAGYPYLLTTEHLSIADINLNVHPTLLPKYRGPATGWHIIAAGEEETGVTIHIIDEGMDTGPIVFQQVVPLSPFDTVRTMMQKTNAAEPAAVLNALELVKAGVEAQEQDENLATAFTEIRTPEDSVFDAGKPVNELYNFIRACDPDNFPAFFYHGGEKIGVKLFRLNKPEDEKDLL